MNGLLHHSLNSDKVFHYDLVFHHDPAIYGQRPRSLSAYLFFLLEV